MGAGGIVCQATFCIRGATQCGQGTGRKGSWHEASRHHFRDRSRGTTFLVQLLTALGLDTGFPDTDAAIFPNCDAGMEWDIRDPQAPYIVKSPMLCDCLDAVLRSGKVVVDHAFIPMRNLFSAAESRRRVMTAQRSGAVRRRGARRTVGYAAARGTRGRAGPEVPRAYAHPCRA